MSKFVSSLEIAAITKRKHFHIMRVIRLLFIELQIPASEQRWEKSIRDSRLLPYVNLPEDLAESIIARYSGVPVQGRPPKDRKILPPEPPKQSEVEITRDWLRSFGR